MILLQEIKKKKKTRDTTKSYGGDWAPILPIFMTSHTSEIVKPHRDRFMPMSKIESILFGQGQAHGRVSSPCSLSIFRPIQGEAPTIRTLYTTQMWFYLFFQIGINKLCWWIELNHRTVWCAFTITTGLSISIHVSSTLHMY